MSDQETNDRIRNVEALRDALRDRDAAEYALMNTYDPAALDHAASQLFLATERVTAAADAVDVEALSGVQAQREAVPADEPEPAPATPDAGAPAPTGDAPADGSGQTDVVAPDPANVPPGQAPAPAQEGEQTATPPQA